MSLTQLSISYSWFAGGLYHMAYHCGTIELQDYDRDSRRLRGPLFRGQSVAPNQDALYVCVPLSYQKFVRFCYRLHWVHKCMSALVMRHVVITT